ncbi:MAG: ribosomal protein S18-alanine N-acetyltransferase [Pseudohongiellaceae bacterium]
MPNTSDYSTQYFARTMRNSDLDLVVKNEAAAYAHPWNKRIFVDCLRGGYLCWVLANKQDIVAHGVMSVAIGECHLLTLCVHPDHQRKGLARKMLTLLLERAVKMDAKECFLEVRQSNTPAIELYSSLGFFQVGQRKNYYPGATEREDALILTRTLPLP